jgi:hypothetical protein
LNFQYFNYEHKLYISEYHELIKAHIREIYIMQPFCLVNGYWKAMRSWEYDPIHAYGWHVQYCHHQQLGTSQNG